MDTNRPYLWLGADNSNPARYTLVIKVAPAVTGFDLSNPSQVQTDVPNKRLILIYTPTNYPPKPPSGTVALIPGNNVGNSPITFDPIAFRKITVILSQNGLTVGSATMLTEKAAPLVYQTYKPQLWLDHTNTSQYILRFDAPLVFNNSQDNPSNKTRTITYNQTAAGGVDYINLNNSGPNPFDPTMIDIITIKVNSGGTEVGEGSTSSSDGDASGGGESLIDDLLD